jgi:hypothetical protein
LTFCRIHGLDVNIIQATSNGSSPAYYQWEDIADGMGQNGVIRQKTFLDDPANLAATDILVISIATDASVYTPARIANLVAYLQGGGRVFLQSEFNETYAGNVAFQSIVNALGSGFQWATQPVQGFLSPLQVLGSLSTETNAAGPITQSFWWGCPALCDDGMERFLEYDGQAFGFIYCAPGGAGGRIITMSDQDLIQNFSTPAVEDLMENILTNLASAHGCDLSAVTCLPLPVELLAFTAECRTEGTLLQWATATEQNSAYFVVDMATDGAAFLWRAEVQAAGWCSTTRSYSFLDQGGMWIPAYYRLSQVDRDGSMHILATIHADACTQGLVLPFYDIAAQQLTMQFPEGSATWQVILFDELGREVAQYAMSNVLRADISALPAGCYQVVLNAPRARRLGCFVKP